MLLSDFTARREPLRASVVLKISHERSGTTRDSEEFFAWGSADISIFIIVRVRIDTNALECLGREGGSVKEQSGFLTQLAAQQSQCLPV